MADKVEPEIDWIHLPAGVSEVSLWSCLHDGELVASKSDLVQRSVSLEFHVRHLLDDKERQSKLRFILRIEDVTSVIAAAHFRSLEGCGETQGLSEEERRKVLDEYYGKWREESYSWKEFEGALGTDPLDVSDANLVSNEREITLRIGGFLNGKKFDDIFFDVFIRGRKLSVTRTDSKDFNIDDFIKLGRDYWDNFGNKDRG